MGILEELGKLLLLDSSTLIGIMAWGNLALAVVVFLFRSFSSYSDYTREIRTMIVIRVVVAFGYAFIFYRNILPDFVSVNLGNTLILTGFYIEQLITMRVTRINTRRFNKLYLATYIAALFLFNVQEFFLHSSSMRVVTASLAIFVLYFLPSMRLVVSKNSSRLKRGIGVFYWVLLSPLIPRMILPLIDTSISVSTNNVVQTLFYLSIIILMVISTLTFFLFLKENSDQQLMLMATRDTLTGLLNRSSFLYQATSAFDQHKLMRREISLLFIDIDHFKNVNDVYGHDTGDVVLREFAAAILNSTRSSDICCRYGGEEFVVMLTGATCEHARMVSERMLANIRRLTFPTKPTLHITASIGAYTLTPENGSLVNDMITEADSAMYEAKQSGRNRIIVRECIIPTSDGSTVQ